MGPALVESVYFAKFISKLLRWKRDAMQFQTETSRIPL
jgi:hypothetical protein